MKPRETLPRSLPDFFFLVLFVLQASLQLANGFVRGSEGFHAVSAKVVSCMLHVLFSATQVRNRCPDLGVRLLRVRRACARMAGGRREGFPRSSVRCRKGRCNPRTPEPGLLEQLDSRFSISGATPPRPNFGSEHRFAPSSTACRLADPVSKPVQRWTVRGFKPCDGSPSLALS